MAVLAQWINSLNSTNSPPPTVTLTSPASGASFVFGTAIPLAATATKTNGSIGKVEFLRDAAKLGEDLTAPYAATLPATTAYATGVHLVRARARDAAGNLSPWSTARVTFNGSALPAGFSRSTFVSWHRQPRC